ncbi:hypothetical protein Pint_14436 [Pistacia integerrima]|uniref:Uncharacterized protein n=1 Tax=Pistacia integerrima TaxID=434235 RepID=A0ACC0Y8D3_9ROSI|nr:hypothetical protein Pint_14436 [Pistacia integerrima]
MGVVILSCEEAMEMELETEKNKTKKDGSSEVFRWERFLPRMVRRVLLVEADDSTRHIICAFLGKCSYRESDSSAFDLEAAVSTTTDQVSGTFSVCDEFERLSGFCLLVALLVLTWSMLFLQNGGGADEKLEDSGKSTSEVHDEAEQESRSWIDLRVALGSGCVQWRRNHQLNSCLEDNVYVALMMNPGEFQFMMTSNPLFELLALCGMLMDYNWIEILKRKELFREAFAGFDPVVVAKMGEKEILEILSDKAIMLAESRVRCILDNANFIMKIVNEFQSFSSFMWDYVNYKPVINEYIYPRNVPLRTPKAEAISKDLLKRGSAAVKFVRALCTESALCISGL